MNQVRAVHAPLVDTFGRLHDNLRISVTDRCNIRCFYCMPEQDAQYMPREELLTYEEIVRFVEAAVSAGVRKVRVTGGEPLVRRDLDVLIANLFGIEGLEDISLTTNGVLLAPNAAKLYAAGLRRINIHLDTLDAARFRQITRRDDLHRVLAGIEACRETGMWPIKINAVAVKGLNEADIVPLARFGREHGIEVRYIEYMPLDSQELWKQSAVLSADEMIARIEEELGALIPIPDQDPRAPATEYRYADGGGKVGFIASVTRPFCGNCNRLRLTSDGKIRYCLFAIEETDVKPLLRRGATDEEIVSVIRGNLSGKWAGHQINSAQFVPPPRPMYAIGG